MNVIQPGGKEEVAGLLRYARGLDPVSSVKEGLETLRRWRTARALAAALHLPPAAPSLNVGSSLIRGPPPLPPLTLGPSEK